MNWKRNRLSYVIWIFYLFLTGYGIYTLAGLWNVRSGRADNILQYGICGGVLLLAGLLNVFVWMIRKKADGKFTLKESGQKWLWTVVFLLILGVGIFLRILALPEMTGGTYFEMAMVRAGENAVPSVHRTEFFYVCALRGICLVLGNQLQFCVWFHLALGVIAGMVCAAGVKKLTGNFSAAVFLAFYYLSPGMIAGAVELHPEPLFLLFFGIGLLVVGAFLNQNDIWPGAYLLTGVVVAFVAYLDLLGLALVGILCTVFYVEREKSFRKLNRPIFALLIALVGVICGAANILALDGYLRGQFFEKTLTTLSDLYFSLGNPSVDLMSVMAETELGLVSASILMFLLALGIYSFFLHRRTERISAWTIMAWIVFLAGHFGGTYPGVGGVGVLALCLSALAGTALSSFRSQRAKKSNVREWDPSIYKKPDAQQTDDAQTESDKQGETSRKRSQAQGYAEMEKKKEPEEAADRKKFAGAAEYAELTPQAEEEKKQAQEPSAKEAQALEIEPAQPEPAQSGHVQAEYVQPELAQSDSAQMSAAKSPASFEETKQEAAPESYFASGQEAAPEQNADLTEAAKTPAPKKLRGGPIGRILEKRRQKKEEQQREIEKVLNALSSLSSERLIVASPDQRPQIYEERTESEPERTASAHGNSRWRAEEDAPANPVPVGAMSAEDLTTEPIMAESAGAEEAPVAAAFAEGNFAQEYPAEGNSVGEYSGEGNFAQEYPAEGNPVGEYSGEGNFAEEYPAEEYPVGEYSAEEYPAEAYPAEASLTETSPVEENDISENSVEAYAADDGSMSDEGGRESAVEVGYEYASPEDEPVQDSEAAQSPDSAKAKADEDESGTQKERPAAAVRREEGRKPLHNPLPVPKKSVTNPMDYDYEVSDDDDYDYE